LYIELPESDWRAGEIPPYWARSPLGHDHPGRDQAAARAARSARSRSRAIAGTGGANHLVGGRSYPGSGQDFSAPAVIAGPAEIGSDPRLWLPGLAANFLTVAKQIPCPRPLTPNAASWPYKVLLAESASDIAVTLLSARHVQPDPPHWRVATSSRAPAPRRVSSWPRRHRVGPHRPTFCAAQHHRGIICLAARQPLLGGRPGRAFRWSIRPDIGGLRSGTIGRNALREEVTLAVAQELQAPASCPRPLIGKLDSQHDHSSPCAHAFEMGP